MNCGTPKATHKLDEFIVIEWPTRKVMVPQTFACVFSIGDKVQSLKTLTGALSKNKYASNVEKPSDENSRYA